MNVQEWIVNKARDALRKLFTTGDLPCWDEGQKLGNHPWRGQISLLHRVSGLYDAQFLKMAFLPEILAYNQDRSTQTLDLSRMYSHPTGRSGPLPRPGGGPHTRTIPGAYTR
jgi:hypothetical protein